MAILSSDLPDYGVTYPGRRPAKTGAIRSCVAMARAGSNDQDSAYDWDSGR